ncbi:MAG: FG-GAP repeat protein, partial [Balneolales bacterium]|nr:FG-GAP repeat protein [Balneolales bacterium]
MSPISGEAPYSMVQKQNSRKVKSLYKWLSKVTGVDACWLDGSRQDGSPAWAVIKRIAHTTWFMVRSSLWRKTAIASLAVIPLLFSPEKVKAQYTALIEDYMLGTPHGFQISGVSNNDRLGDSRTMAVGDVNGDGYDDLILGTPYGDANDTNAGETYVIFGSTSTFSSSFELTDLDGSNGFVIAGIAAGDQT